MKDGKQVVCIIPARGGSKRLPGKNIKPFLGKPMIAYGIEAAKGSRYVDRIVVSTDDEKIAAVAKEYGAEVPFMRPAELAIDEARTLPVLQHAVNFIEKPGEPIGLVVLIQPTTPGIRTADIDAAIEARSASGAETCVSMSEGEGKPELTYAVIDGRLAPATSAPHDTRLCHLNGAVYITPRATLMEHNLILNLDNCAAVVMPRERSTDIDTPEDFATAEVLLRNN